MHPRFYVKGHIQTGEHLVLPESTSHHLSRVLRLNSHDPITIFNGEGGEFECAISNMGKKQVEVVPVTFTDINRHSTIAIHLGMSVLKKDAMDRAIAKAVELGVQVITPIISEHCSVARKVINNRIAHWQQVVISACEQCGLNLLPELLPAANFDQWVNESNAGMKLIADGTGDRFEHQGEVAGIDLVIGPEGGFSPSETTTAFKAGFTAIRFGPRILRAETAPAAAVATIRYALGE